MNLYKLVVDFNEGVKDYVSATLYINDNLYAKMEDIAKPENGNDYTDKWCNGLVSHYSELAKNKIPTGAQLITL